MFNSSFVFLTIVEENLVLQLSSNKNQNYNHSTTNMNEIYISMGSGLCNEIIKNNTSKIRNKHNSLKISEVTRDTVTCQTILKLNLNFYLIH